MSDEIKNFREAVERFDEIQADLEVLKEQLDSSFDNYQSVNENSGETVEKLNSILRSINTLQINLQNTIEGVERQSAEILKAAEAKADAATKSANDLKTKMGKYWSEEYAQTKKDFDNLLLKINGSIDDLKMDIASKIKNAAGGLKVDTTELQNAIREQIREIDITPIENAIDKANRANERLNESIQDMLAYSHNINTSIEKKNNELKEYYKEQDKWIKKLKKQNREFQKAWKTPKKFILIMLSSMLIGLSLGVISAKFIVDKPVVIYKDLDIQELARKSGDANWISTKVLRQEMKNKKTECDLLSFVPWWVILMFGFILLVILSPNEDSKEDHYGSGY